MNERIQELAKQCDLPVGIEHGRWAYEKNVDQFAQLIVQECSSIADDWVNNEDNGENYPSDKIKQHFGVEK